MKQLYIILVGLVAGLCLTAAHAPLEYWYLAIPGLVLAFYGIQRTNSYKTAALFGWWVFFCHFLTALSWISNAVMQVDIDGTVLIPLAKIGIPSAMALYGIILALLVKKAQCYPRYTPILVAALWVLVEVTRSYWPFAFPWIPVGNSLIAILPIAQLASIIGVFGLSFLMALLAAGITYKQRPLVTIMCVVFVVSYFTGKQYMQPTQFTNTTLKLVQPNIPQASKLNPQMYRQNLETLLVGTQTDYAPNFIIWPEAALKGDIENSQGLRKYIQSYMPAESILLLGATRNENSNIYNSLIAMQQAEILATYDKVQLVPFGEYLPLREHFITKLFSKYSGLASGLVSYNNDFSRGTELQTIGLQNHPDFSPLICYESVFSAQVARTDNRPEWLVSLTNDAWYNDSFGPYQHAALTRMRAIEEGVPMVRAANTGISYVTDGHGRIIKQLLYGVLGTIETPLPTIVQRSGLYGVFALYQYNVLLIIFAVIFGIYTIILKVKRI